MYEYYETCPHCDHVTEFISEKQIRGYICTCEKCGRKIFRCDKCLNMRDNPGQCCDWHIENGCGVCFRGRIEERKENQADA